MKGLQSCCYNQKKEIDVEELIENDTFSIDSLRYFLRC